jgi:methionyl-tRNA formyltransferase
VDNRVGYEVLRYLGDAAVAEVVGVIVHPEATALFGRQILAYCAGKRLPCWDIHGARESFDENIKPLHPHYLISVYFDYILDRRFLELPSIEPINLHPGYLPYNKGFYYYVWAVLEGTPAGVSIHRMEADVDAGDIISQVRVPVDAGDTGEMIYKQHEDEAIRLFKGTWPALAERSHKHFRQLHKGTRKKVAETIAVSRIDPHEKLSAIDLINRLRVLTFPDRSGCTIEIDGKAYELTLTMKRLDSDSSRPIPGGTLAKSGAFK